MVLPTVVAATSVRMVASGGPLVVVAPSPAGHIVVALRLASVAKAVTHRGDPGGCRCLSGLGTNRDLPIMPMWCRGKFRGASAPSRGVTLGLLHRGSLKEVPELAVGPSPLYGRGLGHRPE